MHGRLHSMVNCDGDEKQFPALARAAERRLNEFSAQNIANTAGAFEPVDHWDEKLFAALATAVRRRQSQFSAQNAAQHGHLQR